MDLLRNEYSSFKVPIVKPAIQPEWIVRWYYCLIWDTVRQCGVRRRQDANYFSDNLKVSCYQVCRRSAFIFRISFASLDIKYFLENCLPDPGCAFFRRNICFDIFDGTWILIYLDLIITNVVLEKTRFISWLSRSQLNKLKELSADWSRWHDWFPTVNWITLILKKIPDPNCLESMKINGYEHASLSKRAWTFRYFCPDFQAFPYPLATDNNALAKRTIIIQLLASHDLS